MPYYAVGKGRNSGIYQTWGDCEQQVKGFSGARYKKFDTAEAAQQFVNNEGGGPSQAPNARSTYRPNYNNPNQSYSPATNNNNRSATTSYYEYSNDYSGHSSSSGRSTMLMNHKFEKDNEGFVKVFTDGACSANGQDGARAGLGVYWGDNHPLNTSEPVSGRATNNRGEIQAATRAMKQALESGVTKLSINTDSQFLIDSATKWMPNWKNEGWKLQSGEPVKNETDFKELDALQDKLKVKWNYVEAHRGVHGNEMADQLAKAGAAKYDK